MSMQSDTEMLYIGAIEEYAQQNKLLIENVYELFHRHQIFEKIILQHEYLHQVSNDEVLDFILRYWKSRQKNGHIV